MKVGSTKKPVRSSPGEGKGERGSFACFSALSEDSQFLVSGLNARKTYSASQKR